MLEFHKITEEEKEIIGKWKYEGEYALYDSIPYEEQKKIGKGFGNPINQYHVFYDGDKLIGFTNLIDEETEIFFGIGVAPDCCGQGYGQKMTTRTIELAHELFPGKPLYLEVRTWNKRAVACYEKAGFRIVGEPIVQTTHIGEGVFYHMVTE